MPKATPPARSRTSTAPQACSSRLRRAAKPRGALARNRSAALTRPAAAAAPSRQVEPGGLQLGVLLQGMQGLVAPHPRLLEAAERYGEGISVVAVYLRGAGAYGAGHPVRGGDVARPDRRCQSVDDVVRDFDGLVDGLEGDRGQ